MSFPTIQQQGYAGIEYFVPPDEELPRFSRLLERHELAFVPLIFTRGRSVDEHVHSFKEQIKRAGDLVPLRANCHAGKDHWTKEQSRDFFAQVLENIVGQPFEVCFETHRGRILYNPWITRDLCAEFDDLLLTYDLSHWVVVCERLLDTEQEIITRCAPRCLHLHTRVGFEEGPQAPDPRAPEYERHLQVHEAWWQTVWEAQATRGLSHLTFTPEFGPPPYQQTLPYTRAPLADFAAICDWMFGRQVERFQRWKGTTEWL